jgi:hypothetical protein
MRSVCAIDEPSLFDWISRSQRRGFHRLRRGRPCAAAHLLAAAGAKLEHDRAKLLGSKGATGHFHADAAEGASSPARFDADQHQVERIGKAVDDVRCAVGASTDPTLGR